MTMRSQKPTEQFGIIASMDSHIEDIRCYHHQSYMFTRDTNQMSPLLFESDTEDSVQSTAMKCYQEETIANRLSTPIHNRQTFDIMPTLSDFRNRISSQLDTSSQHNQCCSESVLDSSMHRTIIEKKGNTNSAYISPSPRLTRSKLLRSRILTRSAKRLHKISEYSESQKNSSKPRGKNDSRKAIRSSSDEKQSKCKASDKRINEEKLIESIRKSKVRVVLERLKFPFFQNPHRTNGTFIQPNIVPNIAIGDAEMDDGFDFLNRRLSSDVQILSERPAIISISSSESTIRNVSTPPHLRQSPDLFENFESSSASNLCSQNSIDIPNGQVLMCNTELRLSESVTSTPNNQQDSTLMPSILDLFDQDCGTPNVTNLAGHQKLLTEDDRQQTFEITVNEVFDNVIYVAASEETLTPQRITNPIDEGREVTRNNRQPNIVDDCTPQPLPHPPSIDDLVNLSHSTKSASSQEVTPKKRPEICALLNKSVGARLSNPSTPLNRTKWLSKPRSGGSDSDRSLKMSQRCRRLDLWFHDENKHRHQGNVDRKRKFFNLLLSSSEEEDS